MDPTAANAEHRSAAADQVSEMVSRRLSISGMSRRRLAELAGIPEPTLRRKLAAGGAALTLGELLAIANVLDTRVSELIDGDVA